MLVRNDGWKAQGISRRRLMGGAAATLGTWSIGGCGGGSQAQPAIAATPASLAVASPPANTPAPPSTPKTSPSTQGPAALAVMPAWRSAMKPRTWARIGTDMGSVDPARNAALNPNHPNEPPWRGVMGFGAIVAAWSGGAYDRETDTLRIFGGGHQDYAGNEIVQTGLAVEAPQWSLAIAPTVNIGDDSGEVTSVYPDGRPRSSHTYNQVVAVGADLYVHQGSTWRSGVGPSKLFRFRDGAWTNLGGGNPGRGGFGGMCYDEKRHSLVLMGNVYGAPVVRYDIATAVWTKGGDSLMGGETPRLVRIPHLDVVVALWGGAFGVHGYERTPGHLARPPGIKAGEPLSYFVPGIGSRASWSNAGYAFWENGGGDWTDADGIRNGPKPVRKTIASAVTSIDINGIDGDLILYASSNFESASIDGVPVEAFWMHPSSDRGIDLPTHYLTDESTAIIANPARGKVLTLVCSQPGAAVNVFKLRPPILGKWAPSNKHRTGEWVDELGCIVQWDGGTGFDTLTPPAGDPLVEPWIWGRIEAAAGAPSGPQANGTFGRFFYSPRLRALGVANGGAVDMFALA